MDRKFGLYATTSMLAFAAVCVPAGWDANGAEAKDSNAVPEASSDLPAEIALLSAPGNVIYKTRATVASPKETDGVAEATEQPATATRGAFVPEDNTGSDD